MNTDSSKHININIVGSNSGNVIVGDGNVINQFVPSLGALGLDAVQTQRIELALAALREGRAEAQPDAKALKEAISAPDAQTRGQRIKAWLLKIAPHAAKLAGTVVNPVVGELAKAATEWAARALGNKT